MLVEVYYLLRIYVCQVRSLGGGGLWEDDGIKTVRVRFGWGPFERPICSSCRGLQVRKGQEVCTNQLALVP